MRGLVQRPIVPNIQHCVFCGAKGTTYEHVFSRWTHKFMLPRQPGKATSVVGKEYLDRSELVDGKLPGAMRDWQVKCVCGGTRQTCNGGWMKDIEDEAMPVLVPLIQGKRARLSPKDQQIIATWASLKSIISEYGLGGHVTVHPSQRRRMMRKGLPPASRWGVWIGYYERKKWVPEWIGRPLSILPEERFAKRSSRVPTHFNSNATTQVIGRLFIHVIHTPMPGLIERWRFSLPHGGSLFRIWPAAEYSINWPGQVMTDKDADVAATAFAMRVVETARKGALDTPNSTPDVD